MRLFFICFLMLLIGQAPKNAHSQNFASGQIWQFTVAQLNPSEQILNGTMSVDSLDYDDGDIAYYTATLYLHNLILHGTITDIYSVYVVSLEFRDGDNAWYTEVLSDPSRFGGRYSASGSILGNSTGIFAAKLVPSTKLSGKALLADCTQLQGQRVTLEFHPQDGSSIFSHQVSLGADGSFTVSPLPPNRFNVRAKGSKWLAKSFALDTRNGDVSGVVVTLLGGDANDDNSVDVLDLDILIQNFDTSSTDPFWDERADFNCDGSVDVFDLDLLIRNFDQVGDE